MRDSISSWLLCDGAGGAEFPFTMGSDVFLVALLGKMVEFSGGVTGEVGGGVDGD